MPVKGPTRVILPLLAAGMGLLFLVVGLSLRPIVPAGWTTASGVVVDLARSTDDGGTVYAPIVEYRDAAGVVRHYRSSLYLARGLVEQVGQTVELAYDPANPAAVRLLGQSADWGWLIFTSMGALFAIIFAGVAFWQWRGGDGHSPGAATGPPMAVETADGRSVYRFPRARSRLLLDLLLAPVMAVMFALITVVLVAMGGEATLFALLFGAGALLLVGNTVYEIRRGLLRPAAEVGVDGITLRGEGHFAWSELAEVRLERFAGPAGDQGLTMYSRLGLLPRDPERAQRHSLRMAIASAYYQRAMPLAGRRPVEMSPIGVMAYEVADFEGLVERVRRYFPISTVSDEPLVAADSHSTTSPD